MQSGTAENKEVFRHFYTLNTDKDYINTAAIPYI